MDEIAKLELNEKFEGLTEQLDGINAKLESIIAQQSQDKDDRARIEAHIETLILGGRQE